MRQALGTLGAVIILYFAIAGALTVDWGAMVSGDSARVEEEVSEGSGLWGLLSLALFYASYRLALWAWAE